MAIKKIAADLQVGATISLLIPSQSVGVNAQQVLVSHAEAGTFTLSLDAIATSGISFDSSAAETQAILEAHPSIGSGNVSVIGLRLTEGPQLITFIGTLAAQTITKLLVDNTGLSGGEAKAAIAVITQGWTEDDDYGGPDDQTVTVFDNTMAGHVESKFFYYSGQDIFLTTSTVSPGGDEQASWSFSLYGDYSELVPEVGQVVMISDKKGINWVGRIAAIEASVEQDRADFTVTARGFITQVDDKVLTQSLIFAADTRIQDAFVSTLYLLGLPSGGVYYEPALIQDYDKTFVVDSSDQYGKTASQIWSELASLGDDYNHPIIYHVRAKSFDDPGFPWGGLPILEVKSRPFAPKYYVYLRDGLKLKMNWDIDEIVNEYVLRYGDNNTFQQGVAVVQGAAINGIRRQQYIQNSNSLTSGDAVTYGSQLLERHGTFISKGDSFTIPAGMVIRDENGRYVPPWRVRAGFVLSVVDLPPGFPPTDFFITNVHWDQHTNTVTLTTGTLNDLSAALHKAVQKEVVKSRREDTPSSRGLSRGPAEIGFTATNPDKYKPSMSAPDGGVPSVQAPQISSDNLPSFTIFSTINYVLPTSDTEGVLQVDWDCIIREVTIYAPAGESGSADIIVGHSTFDAYPNITNLTSLSVSGTGGTARQTVAQQLERKNVVYFAFPTTPTGYSRVTIALEVEKQYVGKNE